jgi:catechol 2,3-dioxygenase-like lactoylglutathione lyase family enzyme
MSSAVHVSLTVSDLDRSISFYRLLLGEPAKVKPGYAKFVGSNPEIHLALQPGEVRGGGALSHLGIRVASAEEVHLRREVFAARGLETERQTREACCYALQDKFWVTDPDGNRWEVYSVLEDLEEERAEAASCCTSDGRCASEDAGAGAMAR